jgi:hypothetical protein
MDRPYFRPLVTWPAIHIHGEEKLGPARNPLLNISCKIMHIIVFEEVKFNDWPW